MCVKLLSEAEPRREETQNTSRTELALMANSLPGMLALICFILFYKPFSFYSHHLLAPARLAWHEQVLKQWQLGTVLAS